ncbi:MAG TPA: ABC transporter ATP-binding protein, partial [Gammaproteobacteria bacterium]
MTAVVLDIQKVNKCLGNQTVLSDVDLQIPSGEIYGLIGLNGAGKTTLIKCMLDLQRPDSGAIGIFGASSLDRRAREKLIYLPEKFLPPDYMTGWIYLNYVADVYEATIRPAGKNPAWRDEIHRLCAKLELAPEALNKNVRQFSKGMLQKLGLIGCLLSNQQFLILDEPTSGLDPKARVLFRKMIAELRTQGKTVLLCTHILNDIERLCDRVGLLHQGRILFAGTPGECCRKYQAEDLESAFLSSIEKNLTMERT